MRLQTVAALQRLYCAPLVLQKVKQRPKGTVQWKEPKCMSLSEMAERGIRISVQVLARTTV